MLSAIRVDFAAFLRAGEQGPGNPGEPRGTLGNPVDFTRDADPGVPPLETGGKALVQRGEEAMTLSGSVFGCANCLPHFAPLQIVFLQQT